MKLIKRKDVRKILNITSVLNEYMTFLNDLLKNEMNDQWKSLNKTIKKSDKVLLKIKLIASSRVFKFELNT